MTQGLNVKKNFMIELEIMCVNPLSFAIALKESELIRLPQISYNLK